jgi:hypothetical protein
MSIMRRGKSPAAASRPRFWRPHAHLTTKLMGTYSRENFEQIASAIHKDVAEIHKQPL